MPILEGAVVDYMSVIKRAWRIVWRYRILWLFGLFVGSGGGGGGGGSWQSGPGEFDGGPEMQRLERQVEAVGRWAAENVEALIVLAAGLVLLGIVWFVLSIASHAALVHLVNEAEERRPVRGMEGWRAGFRYWPKTFGLGLVLFLPLILGAVFAIIAVLAMLPAFAENGEAVAAAILGLCCFGGLFFLVLLVAGIVVGLLFTLGLRAAVIDDRGVFEAIGDAWWLIRRRFKDVALMWLLVVAIGIGFGILIAILAALLAIPAVFALLAGNVIGAVLVFFVLVLILLLPSAIFSAFISAIWTVFYRDVNRPPDAATAAPPAPGVAPPGVPQAPPPGEGYLPPPPPAAPPVGGQPPAPPVPQRPAAPPVSPGAPSGPQPGEEASQGSEGSEER